MCSLKEEGGLGFRKLDKFNIALLAKQGWRLINFPNSLLARVLKTKYYPSSDFLSAQLGNLPSLTWKSVWSAKGLLEKGLCWRVGKGDHISIWTSVRILQNVLCRSLCLVQCRMISKFGEENHQEPFRLEAPINYYRVLHGFLTITLYRPKTKNSTESYGIYGCPRK